MKEKFLEFVRELIKANPDIAEELMDDEVKTYWEAFSNGTVNDKPVITDNGKAVLAYMKTLTIPMKSTDIAAGMGMASRSVSGSMRKLVSDNFVEKIGDKSAVYIITEKGKNFKID